MHTPTQADIARLTEVCRANQSTVDIYKAERDALVARVAELEGALRGLVDSVAPHAENTVAREGADALQSDVRRALQALGCIMPDSQARAALKGTP